MYIVKETLTLRARALTELHFAEIANGVYEIEKDKYGDYTDKYVDSTLVAISFNEREKVILRRIDGVSISNYNFEH